MNFKFCTYFLTLTLALGLTLFSIGCSGTENNTAEKSPGEEQTEMTAADYIENAAFVSLEGDTVSISDFRGKVVMIDFWETWCKPCLSSFPTLQKLMEEYPDDFVVLAVTPGFTDTREDAKKFAGNHNYDFVYLMDELGLNEQLGVPGRGIPYKVFVAPDGKYITESLGSYGPESDYNKAKGIIEDYR